MIHEAFLLEYYKIQQSDQNAETAEKIPFWLINIISISLIYHNCLSNLIISLDLLVADKKDWWFKYIKTNLYSGILKDRAGPLLGMTISEFRSVRVEIHSPKSSTF